MGYAVRIRRKSGRIELEEWTAYANAAADLVAEGFAERGGQRVPLFRWSDAVFEWNDGEIVIDGMIDEWRRKLGQVADQLGASAIGDDGERYLSDGRVDYGEGPESVQGIRTLAAFRYVPPAKSSRWSARTVVVAVAVLVVVAAAAALGLRR